MSAPETFTVDLMIFPDQKSETLGLHMKKDSGGILVTHVIPDTPMDIAGVLKGDIIVLVNGVELGQQLVEDAAEMLKNMQNNCKKQKSVLDLRVRRSKKNN